MKKSVRNFSRVISCSLAAVMALGSGISSVAAAGVGSDGTRGAGIFAGASFDGASVVGKVADDVDLSCYEEPLDIEAEYERLSKFTNVDVEKKDRDGASAIQPVAINEANFPDPMFRAVISGADYDKDRNGVLSENEITHTRNIHCEGMGVSSIKGVEFFVDLQGLWCQDNNIASMDISMLKDLRGVWCSNNRYTHIDITQNPELVWIYCYDCNLTQLDTSHNPKMAYIECNTNPITSLDLSQNPELEHLMCGSCQLTSLDLSHNPKMGHLDAFRNHFKSLDVSHNPKMKRMNIWDNPGLGNVDISHNPGLQYYNCANNDVTSLDVSHNPELNKLTCSYNDIPKLDLSKNPKLVFLDCACNELSSLDLSKNPYMYFLQAFTNPFTKLNIGNNPFLIQTYKEGVRKSESHLGPVHSWTIDFGGDDSTGGDHIYFLCFDDKVALSMVSTGEPPEEKPIYSDLDEDLNEDELMLRESVVQILYEMAGSPSVNGLTTRFKDVKPGTPFEKALLWGEANAICIGFPHVSDDVFGVGRWIRRQDLVLMLMRYSELMHLKRSIDFGRADDYIDYYDIDYYAWEAVTWAATWHIMEGKGAPGAPKEEQYILPHARVNYKECEEIINNMLEVNGIRNRIKVPKPNPSKIKMPDVLGMQYEAAQNEIRGKLSSSGFTANLQFVVCWVANNDPNKTSTVLYTDPEAGQSIYGYDLTVLLYVAEKPSTTPAPGEPGDPSDPGDPGDPGKDPSFEDFVERLYVVALNRASEKEGKKFWVTKVVNGEYNGADCARYFLLTAPEFMNRKLSNSDFLEVLYHTFYDRDSDASGKKYWLGRLQSGTSRETVVNDFIESTEWCNVCATYGVRSGALYHKAQFASKNAVAFATRLYTCCLGRAPEKKGLNYWSLALTNLEQTGCSAAGLFFNSTEFVGLKLKDYEYIRRLYTTFMGREPEAKELAYWVGHLKNGSQNRQSVLAFFGQSEEFTKICKKYGIERGTI